MNRLLRRDSVVLPLLVCAFSGLTGCGPGLKDRAVVKGKVTIGDQVLTAGTVTFTTKDNRQGSATIGADGTYTMGDAPQGDVTITVAVPEKSAKEKMMGKGMGPAGMGGPGMMGPGMGKEEEKKTLESPVGTNSKMPVPAMPGKVVQIPEKYSKVESSGLTYKVGKGEQTKNIELTP